MSECYSFTGVIKTSKAYCIIIIITRRRRPCINQQKMGALFTVKEKEKAVESIHSPLARSRRTK
jgi:hypothetical protein